jgi:hypothetical protein
MGLAKSDDDGMSFERVQNTPILDREGGDPYSATGTFAVKHKGLWHMWYASGLSWTQVTGRFEHQYQIQSAVSKDLIHWKRDHRNILATKVPKESNTRPTILRYRDLWHMWFCYRGNTDFRDGKQSYRIGYATSDDLKVWRRNDSLSTLAKSKSGWDSKMTPYPYVVKTENDIFMFYCGNGFGQDGFGYAKLEV